ncbi:diguanylate cyclase domain-containing protein [Shewanella intestini]|uniref:diguanylate cyclase n=1 Tax=Shewanella intestini TaxID=2017544 RepID=A0ABS5I068_9GAMM|nr:MULTISPECIES: GGDEF domain-containing protein [Shewanella]MBR9726775.1 diguanylate cyclase [Shewanella intestini]MRG34659.1 diguanylate cyclase [Shewanella sp. XMDDZSB0408]
MNDSNNTVSQIALLKQKLGSAKIALEGINNEHNGKLEQLIHFIGQLSLACKGQNLELDNKLAKLRHRLHNFDSIDEALPELLSIEKLLQSQYRQTMTQLEESRGSLSTLIGQIQRINSAPEKLKKEINYFKQELTKPFHTVWDYIPKMEAMIRFYEQILHDELLQSDHYEILPHHVQLARELATEISEIEFRKDQRDQVLVLKEVLQGDISLDILLESYHTVLSLLLENIAHEKSASQDFLYALNDALTVVRDVVNSSHNNNQRSNQIKQQLNKEINLRVNNADCILVDVNNSTELKVQLTSQLSALKEALSRKEALEQREQNILKKSIDSMRKELNNITQEANSYKEKLFEHQKLNLLDPLTQLANRTALEDRMEQEYRNHIRFKTPLWIAITDIDHFKSVNDSFGHTTGDKTLQVIAMALKNSLRESEFVARYGGEEFVLLLPDVNEEHISQLLNRVREKIKNIPFRFKNQRITVTLSIGAAQVMDHESIEDTFERADAALYRAKSNGRDRIVIDL